MVWSSKYHQPYPCYNLETSIYARRHLICCLFAPKYVIWAVLWHFNLHQPHLSCCSLAFQYMRQSFHYSVQLLTAQVILFLLQFRVLKRESNISSCLKTFKYTSQRLLYVFQPLKTSHVHSLLHFNLQKHHSYFPFPLMTTLDFTYCLF